MKAEAVLQTTTCKTRMCAQYQATTTESKVKIFGSKIMNQ